MEEEPAENDREIVEELREKAKRLELLEHELRELENERNELRQSADEMSEQLQELVGIRDEWEWFFENSLEMLCIAGMDGYFKRVNPTFCKTLGYSADDLLSRPFTEFVHPDDKENTEAELTALGNGVDSVSFENRYIDAEGNWRWMLWFCPAKPASGEKLYAIARDITERKRKEADILYKASHDTLTSLYNRAAFEERLADAMLRHKRKPSNRVSVCLVDLNGFKEVNDSYGHPAGDRVLTTIAKRLRKITRADEMVCRLGGDEFVYVLEGADEEALRILAKRIMDAVCEPIDLGIAVVEVGCSIGISTFPELAKDADTLLEQADAAMYHVKKAGKDGYELWKEE